MTGSYLKEFQDYIPYQYKYKQTISSQVLPRRYVIRVYFLNHVKSVEIILKHKGQSTSCVYLGDLIGTSVLLTPLLLLDSRYSNKVVIRKSLILFTVSLVETLTDSTCSQWSTYYASESRTTLRAEKRGQIRGDRKVTFVPATNKFESPFIIVRVRDKPKRKMSIINYRMNRRTVSRSTVRLVVRRSKTSWKYRCQDTPPQIIIDVKCRLHRLQGSNSLDGLIVQSLGLKFYFSLPIVSFQRVGGTGVVVITLQSSGLPLLPTD